MEAFLLFYLVPFLVLFMQMHLVAHVFCPKPQAPAQAYGPQQLSFLMTYLVETHCVTA